MTNQLQIKNFKRIKDEIALNDFSRVNYLVGENGCGKTSIINALSHLRDGSNARRFFGKDSIVEFSLGNTSQYLAWNSDDPNKTSHVGNLGPILYNFSHDVSEKGANSIVNTLSRREINISEETILKSLNKFLSDIGHPTLDAEKIINNTNAWDKDIGRLVFKEQNDEIVPNFMADGVKIFYNFYTYLASIQNRLITTKQTETLLLLIEEPETHLHPKWQKKIPELLNDFISQVDESLKSRIFFFVSTHSPFIIGAAASYNDQKVYLIDNGALLNLKHERVSCSEGYKGGECADVVGRMLGADVTDLGYPENYCILEENSMLAILNDVKDKKIIKNVTFVSAAGVDNTQNFANAIVSLDTLIKCNPFYSDKYHLIVDKPKTPYSQNSKIGKIKDRLGDRFIELQKASLEDYYQNIDDALYTEVKKAIADKPKEKGIVKGEYANKISEKINSAEDFSKLFGNELDFLLN